MAGGGGLPRPLRLARAVALAAGAAALVLASLALLAPVARAAWSAPFEFAPPGSLDTLPSQVAISSRGVVAATFTVLDVDSPADAQAFVVVRAPSGQIAAPQPIPGAQQALGLTYDGASLELLTGSGPRTLSCCSSVSAVSLSSAGTFGRPRKLIGGLAGATLGRIETLGDGRLLAAAATERGVWSNEATRANRFANTHLLTGRASEPRTLAIAGIGRFSSAVAWTAARFSDADARSIFLATGSRATPPRKARVALTVPVGHGIDQLGLAGGPRLPTAAWIESWRDRHGFHSVVKAADLEAKPQARTLSPRGQSAVGLALAGNVAGALAATWESCARAGACSLFAAVRSAHGRFRRAASLGPADATETPAVAVGRAGQVLVAWVRGGHPVAAELPAHGSSFGPSSQLSSTRFAADVTLAFGPGRDAIAAWTQGTLNPTVVGAQLTG